MRKSLKSLSLGAALLLASPFSALGAEGVAFPEACRPDLERYCGEVTPGGGRLVACLKAHEDKLSEECQGLAEDVKTSVRRVVLDCWQDAFRSCAGVKPGEGRIVQCLVDQGPQLSKSCRGHVKSLSRLAAHLKKQ